MSGTKQLAEIVSKQINELSSSRSASSRVKTLVVEDDRAHTSPERKCLTGITDKELGETVGEIQEVIEDILARPDVLPTEENPVEGLRVLEATEYAVEVALLKRELAYLRGEISREEFEVERDKIDLSYRHLTLRWQKESSLQYIQDLMDV